MRPWLPPKRSLPTRQRPWSGAASDPRPPADASPISRCRKTPGEPLEIYVATTSGGIFKSTNEGVSWTPVFDHAGGMMSIGAVAVAPSNPLGGLGGHRRGRQPPELLVGRRRLQIASTAARTGRRWGSTETRHIGKIVIHPTDPNTVYVAAVGHLWGSNTERGVFKTTDGGKTWKQGPVSRTRTPAPSTWPWIPGIPTSSSPPCISGSAKAGASTAAAPAAASTAPPTAAPPGPN